jgi:hypothetical protein
MLAPHSKQHMSEATPTSPMPATTETPAAVPEPEPPLSIEDAAGTSSDYPFNKFRDWETYKSALGEAMSTEFAAESYPKYIKNDDNLLIVKRFIKNGLDPEQALEDILEVAFNEGARYCSEFQGTIIQLVRYLHKVKKAPLYAGSIIGRSYDVDLETELYSTISTRAAILDTFRPKLSERMIADLRRVYENPPEDQECNDGDYDEDEEYDDSNDDDIFYYALIEESSYLTELVQAKPAVKAEP